MRSVLVVVLLLAGVDAGAATLELLAVPDLANAPDPVPGSAPGSAVPAAPSTPAVPLPELVGPRRVPAGPGGADPTLVATAGGLGLALVAFGLYSRLGRGELLLHGRRDALLRLIGASPGITPTRLAERAGLAWGVLSYHLDRLERAGHVVSERVGGRRAYFPAGAVPREARAGLGTLQEDTARNVARFVAERPGATQTDLCEGLGLSASAASKQVTKLEGAGLVRRERRDRCVRLHPEPRLASMLAA